MTTGHGTTLVLQSVPFPLTIAYMCGNLGHFGNLLGSKSPLAGSISSYQHFSSNSSAAYDQHLHPLPHPMWTLHLWFSGLINGSCLLVLLQVLLLLVVVILVKEQFDELRRMIFGVEPVFDCFSGDLIVTHVDFTFACKAKVQHSSALCSVEPLETLVGVLHHSLTQECFNGLSTNSQM